jgi:hypothetical protein
MTKRTPKQQNTAAGKPAVILPSVVTEQDRAIVARREAGETRKAICEALGITVSAVQRAEYHAFREQQAQELLAKHPDSIVGLDWLGVLNDAAGPLRCHKYHYEGGELERLSDVAALGRHYVSCLKGIGPKSLASIDRALALLGIAWSPIERTPQPTPPRVEQPQPDESDARVWLLIGRLEAEIEDLRQRVARLERLYVSSLPGGDETDDADDSREDLESVGNIVCMPGVRLADVLPQNGDAS